MLGRSAWVSLAQIAQVFLNGTDVLIIGKLLGPAAVVPYSCTSKLVTVLANHRGARSAATRHAECSTSRRPYARQRHSAAQAADSARAFSGAW